MTAEELIAPQLEALLQDARRDGIFSAAVFDVGTRTGSLTRKAVGTISWTGTPTRLDTPFDIASITKPIIALLAMVLCESGDLTLDDTVADHLADYASTDKKEITIRQLLTHTSGIPGQQPLYRTSPSASDLLAALRELPLGYAPGRGVAYTSQGFILLGQILQSVAGEGLDRCLQREVLEPLRMSSTTFHLPPAARRVAAATEWCLWRQRLVQGTVHDENAHVLGGCAGHAGLFSTVDDLGRLCQAMLENTETDSGRLMSPSAAELMTTRHTPTDIEARALGWQGWDTADSPAGSRFSAHSYGHTGFTGTSVWIDPLGDMYVVLLTNAVHPRRVPHRIQSLRPRFHDLAVQLAASHPLTGSTA